MKSLFFTILFFAGLMLIACSEDDPGTPGIQHDLPTVSVGDVTLQEGDQNRTFNFSVFLNKTFDQEVKVDFTTQGNSAEADVDFVSTSGTLVFAANDREEMVSVEILADTIRELDEDFRLVLSNPVNAIINDGEGIGTIRNDDTFVPVSQDGYETPENYAGFNLVWQDEFNGPSLNLDNWTHELGASGWGNNEWQFYTERAENSYISNGSLVIEAKKENYQGSDYTSARIITQNKQSFTYGRVDIRAILPEGQGIWPALWMLGDNFSTVGWPACGEIDIMELLGHEPSKIHGTAHWGAQGQGFSHNKGGVHSISGEKFSDKYHVFSIIWEPNSIKWYVNDNEFFRLTNNDVNGNYPFNEAFFFIFNVAVGGNWPGYPDASTQFPQRMYVDYIRVFQKQ